ncbi:TPA: DUF1372 family protein [Streptococcus agalactiae]|uniref:DUF1372 family protein n=1 Tax=Streptococcus TaxID=1301 RepID=UPI0002BB0FB6|nr:MULTISPECIES: DUF1372 family protein [Streptococcus]APZ82127.1 hypothetical protein STR03_41 [Streptococcus phage Str03]AYJ75019.1 hypothetical protein [Streptococcus phage LF3]QBX24203.1 hypothetical protein Javan18_0019 [Streptococcus phage Javan18]HEP3198450.1 DUF1372 family protein [Streptococcus pyogenes]EMA8748459.1 DUF1372 family protein [Streptococcus agalactiae]
MKNMNWKAFFNNLKAFASVIIITVFVLGFNYLFYEIGYQKGHQEADRVIIYVADNAGAEMFGKITDKEIIEGRHTVTAGAYGKFLVTEEQYNEITVGDDIPDYLKGRGN